MKSLGICYLIFALVIFDSGVVLAQSCVDPAGERGEVLYSRDFGTFQGCTSDGWKPFHEPRCPAGDACDPCHPINSPIPGTQCADESFYIGNSPEDGERVYMTGAIFEGDGISFDSETCFRCGDGSISNSQADGRANTDALLAFNANGFDAAAHCEELNTIKAHGHDGWYLPAGGPNGSSSEINLLWLMIQAEGVVGGLTASSSDRYWSSSAFNTNNARVQRFSDGAQSDYAKDLSARVRCVRR